MRENSIQNPAWRPGTIGTLEISNRIVMTAMGTDLAEGDGIAGPRLAAYYAARARGGAGLIMTGAAAVSYPYGQLIPGGLAISEERHVDGIRAIADAVHAEGRPLGVQLNHNGIKAAQDWLAGRPLWAPSVPPDALRQADPHDSTKTYHPMTHADIARVVGQFAAAAERVRRAGADAVEVSAAHGYLLSSFLSPFTNSRTDEYGGSVENRTRFLVEVLTAIRAAVGADFPVWCKIDSQEFLLAEGITVDDAITTARLVEQAGADAIAVSAYADPRVGGMHMLWSHTPLEPGHLMPNAARVRAAVSIPVISAGRMDPVRADQHIAAGDVDFVGIGRKLLADPELPRKVRDGAAADARPCVYGFVCISEISTGGHIRCTANPEMGRERKLGVRPSERSQTIAIVGGGPAGMEAAHRLARAGHRVTLIERDAVLGGALRFAGATYGPIADMVTWLEKQVRSLTIDVRLNTDATPEILDALAPDAVIIATGGSREEHPIGGTAVPVMSGRAALEWATSGSVAPGERRVVIVDGSPEGLALALLRSGQGDAVTVLDTIDSFGAGWASIRRELALKQARERNVTLLPGAQEISTTDAGVRYTTAGGQTRTIGADLVLVAKNQHIESTLALALQSRGTPVHIIGDAARLGSLDGALSDAAELAAALA